MFQGPTAFDQDIGSWNVSNGQNFVSEIKIEQIKYILTILLIVIIFTSISITEWHV